MDGDHFFDLLAEDVVFDFVITVPDYPRHVVGRRPSREVPLSGTSPSYRSLDRIFQASSSEINFDQVCLLLDKRAQALLAIAAARPAPSAACSSWPPRR